ncbi:hypothetical protein [Ottowia sp.]|uniref:hypothetical protein n=1 Tax=Ottowia sp. TaxID=1898956 RepID=UPI002C680C0E|nr:hypothetical protein [Ottowia sp.]HNR84902.1 hypothetical protein [Ottowia sp.]
MRRRLLRFGDCGSYFAVIRLVHRWRTTGSAQVRGTAGRPRYRLEQHGALVDRLLSAKRDSTLEELREALAAEGVIVGARRSIAI